MNSQPTLDDLYFDCRQLLSDPTLRQQLGAIALTQTFRKLDEIMLGIADLAQAKSELTTIHQALLEKCNVKRTART